MEPGRKVLLTVAHGRVADAQLVPSRLQGMTGRTRRKRIALKTLARIDGGELIIRGGTWCAVAFEDGRPVNVIGNAAAVLWNGEPVPQLAGSQ